MSRLRHVAMALAILFAGCAHANQATTVYYEDGSHGTCVPPSDIRAKGPLGVDAYPCFRDTPRTTYGLRGSL